jgi:hypothetical protein
MTKKIKQNVITPEIKARQENFRLRNRLVVLGRLHNYLCDLAMAARHRDYVKVDILWDKIEAFVPRKKRYRYFSAAYKLHVVETYSRASLPEKTALLRYYGLRSHTVRDWIAAYSSRGIDGLQLSKGRQMYHRQSDPLLAAIESSNNAEGAPLKQMPLLIPSREALPQQTNLPDSKELHFLKLNDDFELI